MRSTSLILVLAPLSTRAFAQPSLLRPAYTFARAMSSAPLNPPDYNRKAGVSPTLELASFVSSAGPNLVVIDARNPDFSVEPGDDISSKNAPLAQSGPNYRPNAYNLAWDRPSKSMPALPDSISLDTPIITHCGGGGRGQKSCDFLKEKVRRAE